MQKPPWNYYHETLQNKANKEHQLCSKSDRPTTFATKQWDIEQRQQLLHQIFIKKMKNKTTTFVNKVNKERNNKKCKPFVIKKMELCWALWFKNGTTDLAKARALKQFAILERVLIKCQNVTHSIEVKTSKKEYKMK